MWPEHERDRAPVGDFPPIWASAFGDDRYGLWADLSVNGATQRLRWIEPGDFLMGSTAAERKADPKDIRDWTDKREEPQHPVTIQRGFWLADTPCTQAFWLAVMGGDNPSEFKTAELAPEHPVEQVTWHDTEKFVLALATLTTADPQLPTEAQWEYACRADTTSAYWWGADADGARANMGRLAGPSTTPVKRYAPNPWGLHDMHGNVWEWCLDDLQPYQAWSETDPSGGGDSDTRALRGGSWLNRAARARLAYRLGSPRGRRHHHIGFRFLLRSPAQPGPGGPGGWSGLGKP